MYDTLYVEQQLDEFGRHILRITISHLKCARSPRFRGGFSVIELFHVTVPQAKAPIAEICVAKVMIRTRNRHSVGPLLSVTHCLMLPRVEVTGCGHKAKCPLAVRPGPAVLAGPMG